MKKSIRSLAAVTTLATIAATGTSLAHADDFYAGAGLPGLVTVGYAHNLSDSVNIRGDLAGGLNSSTDGVNEGVNATATLKSTTAGLYGDWFPLTDSAFRLVGGLTFNDTSFKIEAAGSGSSTFNGTTVNMAGEYYRVKVAMPDVTPYIGIGYGHKSNAHPGLGFYADVGVMIGTMTVKSETSLVTSGKLTQADINAQDEKIRDSVNKVSAMPVISLGLVYRF